MIARMLALPGVIRSAAPCRGHVGNYLGGVRTGYVNGNQITPRTLIRLHDRIWQVRSTMATRTGKGGAYAQLELRDIVHGTKKVERVRAAESLETVDLDPKRTFTLLYTEGEKLVLMEDETFEQLEIPKEMMDHQAMFLKDGVALTVECLEGKPLLANLKDKYVPLRVTETRPSQNHVKVDLKPAWLENGLQVRIPPYVSEGDTVLVDVVEKAYAGRASED